MRYAERVKGTRIGFAYEHSGRFEEVRHLRRQADRDAAEVRAVAAEHQATRAIGFSRGARAIVGALADEAALFDRIVLVIPPGGQPAGKYSSWLEALPTAGRDDLRADILVIGNRGDTGHPARVAQAWAEQLDAEVEILPPRAVYTDPGAVMDLVAGFLNGRGRRRARIGA